MQLQYGGSGTLLSNLRVAGRGDLFTVILIRQPGATAIQSLVVGKNSRHQHLMERLLAALRSAKSQQTFPFRGLSLASRARLRLSLNLWVGADVRRLISPLPKARASFRRLLRFKVPMRGIKPWPIPRNRWMGRQVLECAGPLALFGSIESGRRPPQSKTLARRIEARCSTDAALCLDGPPSALDDGARAEMCEVLRSVRARTGLAVLDVTHNLWEARQLADRVFLLRDGHLFPNDEAILSRAGQGPRGS